MSTEQDKIKALRNILYLHADESDDTEAAYAHVDKMSANNATEKDYVLALADGLKYGNWPWIDYRQQTKFADAAPMHYIGCPAYNDNKGSCNCSKMARE